MSAPVRKLKWQELIEVRKIRNLCISVVETREGVSPEITVVIYGTANGADEVARLPANEKHAVSRMITMAEAIADTVELVGESWLGVEAMSEPPTF